MAGRAKPLDPESCDCGRWGRDDRAQTAGAVARRCGQGARQDRSGGRFAAARGDGIHVAVAGHSRQGRRACAHGRRAVGSALSPMAARHRALPPTLIIEDTLPELCHSGLDCEPMIPFSILDLSPVAMGSNAAQSLRNTLDLARHAEKWGYRRYWLAEHHSMPGIASAATSVVICHVASGTSTIRVGAGGIMLPNHSPLVMAEQFGTLESLFPGRIDLGLGRAPGSDQVTARALRRNLASDPDQ